MGPRPVRRTLALAPLLLVLGGCSKGGSEGAAAAPSGSLTNLVASGVVRPAVDRGDLDASVAWGAQLLEEKRYREFVMDFAAPSDRAALEQHGGVDGILAEFGKSKAPKLLEYLRAAQRATPARDGDLATYALEGATKLIFVRERGRWYLKNGG